MSEPWFRPWARFSYEPTTWQGRVVIAAMVVVTVPLGLVFLIYSESRPLMAWAAGGVSVVAFFVGHAIVLWKMDRDYRR